MRIKRGVTARARKKKYLKRASGFYGRKSTTYSAARETVDRALMYEYRDRKVRKRDFRSLWITRINAAARLNGTTYHELMGALTKNGIAVNRKILAELAVVDPAAFSHLVKAAL